MDDDRDTKRGHDPRAQRQGESLLTVGETRNGSGSLISSE